MKRLLFLETFLWRKRACGLNKAAFQRGRSGGAPRRTLPGWAEEKDVLRLWQVDHLSFEPQTADLHPRQLVLVLGRLHIQQALLSGPHQWIFHYLLLQICSNLWAPVQTFLHALFLYTCPTCVWLFCWSVTNLILHQSGRISPGVKERRQ